MLMNEERLLRELERMRAHVSHLERELNLFHRGHGSDARSVESKASKSDPSSSITPNIQEWGGIETLADSAQRLHTAISSVDTVGVLFFRLDGAITYVNAAFARMSGYTREELTNGVNWEMLTAPEFDVSTKRVAEELATSGQTAPYEKKFVRKSGTRWWGLCAPTRVAGTGTASECIEFIIDISDRKQAEFELRRSEERYRFIVEGARDYAIITIDPAGRITNWPPGAEAVFGWSAEEAIGQLVLFTFTPEDRAAGVPEKELEAASRDGSTPDVRWHVGKDGSRIFIEGVVRALKDEHGEIQGFLKIGQDVTQRREAEESLRLSAKRDAFRVRFADTIRLIREPAGLQATAARVLGEYLNANRVFYAEIDEPQALGFVERDYISGVESMAGSLRVTDFGPAIFEGLRTGNAVVMNDVNAWPELSSEHLRTYTRFRIAAQVLVPLVKAGRLAAILAVHRADPQEWAGRDVSLMEEVAERTWAAVERARAEAALRASEERLRLFVENVREYALLQTDRKGVVISWNPGAERLFGYGSAEMLGQDISRVLRPEDQSAELFTKEIESVCTGDRIETTRWLIRKDGNHFLARWVTEPIRDEAGKIRGVSKILQDITEKQRETEVMYQRQKLESIGLLAGGIAHDFNNLLTPIIGNASMVLNEIPSGPARRLNEVITAAERAARLIKQLLAFAGEGQFVAQNLDISEAVQEIRGLVDFSIPKSVEFSISVPRRIPLVRMDPSQLQQILMNLVINAGEAIGEGNPGRITITVSSTEIETPLLDAIGQQIQPGRYACIKVSDTGLGIREEDRQKLFDPFFTTKFTGRGLGLAAVAGILRAQGGGITLQSTPGQGSTFTVFLPLAEQHAEPRALGLTDKPAGTILVIDDEASVRNFIGEVLRRSGYRVLKASDGGEALSICEREKGLIDGVVLDVAMPVMGAHDLLPILRSKWPALKILLTSGYSESEARRLSAAYPGVAFIQKPYTAQRIAKSVSEILSQK